VTTAVDTQNADAAEEAAASPDSAPLEDWRGVAAEDSDEVSAKGGVFLRARSRRLLGSLIRPHGRALLVATVLIVVVTAFEMCAPYLVSVGIDDGMPAVRHGDWTPIALAAAGIGGSALIGSLLRLKFLTLAGRIGQDMLLELRRRVFHQFQALPIAFHEKYTSGRVISRLTNDLDALNDLINSSLDGLISALLNIAVIGALLVVIDPVLSLIVLVCLPALGALLIWYTKGSRIAYRRQRAAVAACIVQFVETLNGIRAVQSFRREARNREIFSKLNQEYVDANAKSMMMFGWFVPGIVAVGGTATAAVLVFGGFQVMDGRLQVGLLTAYILYMRKFFDPMQDLAVFYTSYQSATAALEKLSGVLEERPEVPEPDEPKELPEQVRGQIRFGGVRFSYPKREKDEAERIVLPGLDLEIPAGQTVALVGATGAGKSTLARLMCRFYDPVAGRVELDGIDLRDLRDRDLRRAVIMVTQENFLFSGSVADNIRFGRPEATDEEVEHAARAIGAHEFISRLPEGYRTDVKKRGGRLSAGQRQLVAFARAFLADPAVLILDEATSSLDVPSERLVQRALRTILADRTALIIAHRLSTVEIADRVLVMEAGRIVEDGAPEALIALQGADADAPSRFAALHEAWRESLV
jgi:ABC-type multidrug transport system fused ATPase/permease subunit